ncbi:WXG100 family type VII secretion target [Streptomyces sp. HB2AG]|uniref:WXG100 family type VII secretion target n=1 Tax=Streptomyces sp. HB2AG TaxID=2983400 RepID=UPI0022AA4703|nr:WXG100 family type VII secretion target [Streptomyces sp. HB2AG]MCZ2525921.1 WXG100 family type VII secretion target [Streptomyces sp. HB2AG]
MSGTIAAGTTVTDLVPGDPDKVDALAARLSSHGKSFADSAQMLRGLDTSSWTGEAAEGFRTAVAKLPAGLDRAQEAFASAQRAVDAYADVLRQAQKDVKALLDDAAEARLASRKHSYAVEDYRQAVERGDVNPGKPPEEDPGAVAMVSVLAKVEAAQARVDAAAVTADRVLRAAAEAAPDKPGLWEQAKDWAGGIKQGFTEAGLDLLKTGIKSQPLYAVVDPAGFLTQLTSTADGLIWGVQNPKQFLLAATDWETWQTDPARALGRMGPDALLGLATGGFGGAATRAAGAARRGTGAAREAAEAAQDAANAGRRIDNGIPDGPGSGQRPDGGGKDLDPDDPRSLPAAANKDVDVDSIDNPVWRQDHEPVWRNDNRPPQEIFEDGFQPRDASNTDLEGYVEGNHPSAFVGTTRDPDANWLTRYRYEVDAPGGIDVNETLPNNKYREVDQEVAFPGGIDRKHIKGGWEILPNGEKGQWIPNPHYEPSTPKAPASSPPPSAGLPEGWTR